MNLCLIIALKHTHDLCDTAAVLYRLSYQAICDLVTLSVRNIPVESEECK